MLAGGHQAGYVESGTGLLLPEGLPAVVHEATATVVIADLHLGYEEALTRDGVFLPRVQLRNALTLVHKLSYTGARRLVIAGDIKHAFSRLLRQEREEVTRLLEEAVSRFSEVVVVRGNHDNYIQHVVKDAGAEFIDDYLDLGSGVIVTHGHKDIGDEGRLVIIGHEHPSIAVSIGGGRVKFPLHLEVPLDDGRIVHVLPAAGAYQTGNPVTLDRESYLSPIIRNHARIHEATPYLLDENTGVMPMGRLDILLSVAGP